VAKTKFKQGDNIKVKEVFKGVSEATVLALLKEGYYCKIMNGTAIIPYCAECNYELKK